MPQLADAIRRARHPVVLTGAGVSAPSGIPTYQNRWKGRSMRDFLSRRYYSSDPVGFFELFCAMEAWSHAEPNAAHAALASLNVPIITQNIDGLHQRAGSRKVIELHGNLQTVHCPACSRLIPAAPFCRQFKLLLEQKDAAAAKDHLRCGCGGMMDTNVVLYEDAVRGFETAVDWLMASDLLVVIGTSLETYPAASLPQIAAERNVRVLIENNDCIGALTG